MVERERDRRLRCVFTLLFFAIASLSAISFVSCIAAEINTTQFRDIKMDGKSCYLPKSKAFKYGIAALACLTVSQVIGGAFICVTFSSLKNCSSRILNTIKIFFFLLSWISFGSVVVLLGTSTSMNSEQSYGEGWIDGECYLVRRRVYVASAVLIIFSSASTLLTAIFTASGFQSERKRHSLHSRAG